MISLFVVVNYYGQIVEILPPYHVSKEELDAFYGDGNWRQIPSEIYKRLRYEPASWTVEVHTVEVYVGTDGDHQDEFIRGERPKDLLRNSIVTPSLLTAILNVKYVNSSDRAGIRAQWCKDIPADHVQLDHQMC